MRKMTEIPPKQDHRPIELRHLRVAAYCRVSTELEEQTSSIELQERHYSQLFPGIPQQIPIGKVPAFLQKELLA